jgi:hypothetical protein
MHVSNQSEIADHCCGFALSVGTSDDFAVTCEHLHNKSCSNCDSLQMVVKSIEDALESDKIQFESEDQKDEVRYTLIQVILLK